MKNKNGLSVSRNHNLVRMYDSVKFIGVILIGKNFDACRNIFV